MRQQVQHRIRRHIYILDLFISRDYEICILWLFPLLYPYRNMMFRLMLFRTRNISQVWFRCSSGALISDIGSTRWYWSSGECIYTKRHLRRSRNTKKGYYHGTVRSCWRKRHRMCCVWLWIRTGLYSQYEMFKISKIQTRNDLASEKQLNITIKRSKHAKEFKALFSMLWIKYYIKTHLSSQILSIQTKKWPIILITSTVNRYQIYIKSSLPAPYHRVYHC